MNTTACTSESARRAVTAAVVMLLGAAGAALASPALNIQAPPVVNGVGPPFDPTGSMGQWFQRTTTAGTVVQESRAYEFYDNIAGDGGGAPNHLAIRGGLLAIIPGAPGFAAGYTMRASITNNTPAVQGGFQSGRNMHQEFLPAPQPFYVGPMQDVKLTLHWADDGIMGNFNAGGANLPSPNSAPAPAAFGESNTYAINYDQLGWYSFPVGSAASPPGAFQVPTYDFGNIAVGQTVTRDISFGFYQQIPINLISTLLVGQDLLIARSNDLKIGAYFQPDPVLNSIVDNGSAYPFGGLPGAMGFDLGNASVFFSIPTPGAAALMGLGALAAARRRR